MFDPTQLVINAFVEELKTTYLHTYSTLEPDFPGIISYVGRMALENIANSDAPYHDMYHTIQVTMVGQQILRGKHIREGGVSPADWLHFVIGLLCHDIGYVRGVLKGDSSGDYVINREGETTSLPAGATDASLTRYHVDRGKIFVEERFGKQSRIDSARIVECIEHSRFPIPKVSDYDNTSDAPGLLRAADLIGQLADPNYMRKLPALFREFEETGMSVRLGCRNAGELRAMYPTFYWKAVCPYIEEALMYLRVTQEGKQWIANLYAHVFAEEHKAPTFGPERTVF